MALSTLARVERRREGRPGIPTADACSHSPRISVSAQSPEQRLGELLQASNLRGSMDSGLSNFNLTHRLRSPCSHPMPYQSIHRRRKSFTSKTSASETGESIFVTCSAKPIRRSIFWLAKVMSSHLGFIFFHFLIVIWAIFLDMIVLGSQNLV
ncbi:hypothetical protein LINPERHAP1_LOCUS1528 [Linum perenne]